MAQPPYDPLLEALFQESSTVLIAAVPVREPGCYGTVQLYCSSARYSSPYATIAERVAESFALFVEDEVFTDEL